jgi:hypothetical protein
MSERALRKIAQVREWGEQQRRWKVGSRVNTKRSDFDQQRLLRTPQSC